MSRVVSIRLRITERTIRGCVRESATSVVHNRANNSTRECVSTYFAVYHPLICAVVGSRWYSWTLLEAASLRKCERVG